MLYIKPLGEGHQRLFTAIAGMAELDMAHSYNKEHKKCDVGSFVIQKSDHSLLKFQIQAVFQHHCAIITYLTQVGW